MSRFLFRARPLFRPTQRTFVDKVTLDQQEIVPFTEEDQKKEQAISLWQEQVKSSQNALILKDHEEIERYVISLVQNYFRTTRKQSVSLNSELSEHGLDSLDQIELVIQLEDELGLVVDAENLGKFTKPKHFVNFISHMNQYRAEFNKLPQDGIHHKVSWGFRGYRKLPLRFRIQGHYTNRC